VALEVGGPVFGLEAIPSGIATLKDRCGLRITAFEAREKYRGIRTEG